METLTLTQDNFEDYCFTDSGRYSRKYKGSSLAPLFRSYSTLSPYIAQVDREAYLELPSVSKVTINPRDKSLIVSYFNDADKVDVYPLEVDETCNCFRLKIG